MRPSRDQMLMEVAQVISARATCSRAQVGVVVHRQGRILVTGYNGAPAGIDHCDHTCDCGGLGSRAEMGRPVVLKGDDEDLHYTDCASEQPCLISVHAECNAIAWAARWGISLEGSELFTTMCPCLPCAQLIINAGITRVIASQAYRSPEGLALLKKVGIALA